MASTFPSTCTATLATGAWPAEHGIVADTWYDRTAQKPVPASEEDLLATTLASEISGGHSRVYVAGMEASHTGIFAGTPAASIYWMDESGNFRTRGETPDWLENFNLRKSAPANLHDSKWTVLNTRPGVPAVENAPPLRVLSYDPAHPRDFINLYKSSPCAQTAQFELLNEMITHEALGQRNSFDFVCLLAGASTRLGYECGGRGTLMEQMLLHLDRSIEGLISACNRVPGEGNFNLVVAGSHGGPATPPEDSSARMMVKGESVAQAIDGALRKESLGHVEKYVYPFLYLDTAGFRDPEEVRRSAAHAAMNVPAVAGYYTAAGGCSVRDEWVIRFSNSFHPKRSGDVMLSYRPGYTEDFHQGRGLSYGSLYNYDVAVPLWLYGPQFRPGVHQDAIESVDLAPTLAAISGVAAPSSSTGRVLSEALTE